MHKLMWVALLAVAGCGGTSVDKACADYATARCNKRQACATGNGGIQKVFGDMTTCLAREKLSCTQALDAKGNANTPDNEERCAAAWTAASCNDFLIGNPPAVCVVVGPGVTGAACVFAGQCQASACNGTRTAICGTCGTAPAAGEDCSASTCQHGLNCITQASGAQVCVAEGGAGAACNRDTPCQSGFGCIGSTMTAMGACMADATSAGAACDARTGPGCDRSHGLSCNGTSKTCTAVTYAAGGAACGTTAGGDVVDCAGGACFGSTGTTMGTCKPDGSDGAPCDTVNGPNCLPPSRCVPTSAGGTAGTCALPDGSQC